MKDEGLTAELTHPRSADVQRLVLILGPTGVGKSDLAVDLAERFNGEIVGADSRQIYRRLDIGTAKPEWALRERVPHHLIDFLDPTEPFDLATYQRLAWAAFEDIWTRRGLPFLVGGTMQYVRAITAGWVLPPAEPDRALRDRLLARAERVGSATLYAELIERDPTAADFVSPSNLRRIVRALEVCLTTGAPYSRSRQSRPPDLGMLKIVLTMDRAARYDRVDHRADQMFERGLIAEVAGLLTSRYDPNSPAFTGIGYREAVACLRGELTADQARDRLKFATHRYIRQQYAWLRREPGVHWIEVRPGAEEAAREAVARLVARFLAGGRHAE